MAREALDITGLWRFQPDPYGEGGKVGYHQPGHDPRRWREVRVPCGFDRCGPGLETFEGAGWFRRSLRVPEGWRGRRVVLRFEGINNRSRVWVNGQQVAQSDDPFLPVETAVDPLLRWGEDNEVVVLADTTRRPGDVPGRERGWRPQGGILRECSLVAMDPLHLSDAWVVAEPRGGGGSLTISAEVINRRDRPVEARVLVAVQDLRGESVASLATGPVDLEPGARTLISLSEAVDPVRPWSPADPTLYQARVSLVAEDETADALDRRFGFRSVEARDGRLWLNGEPLFLTGLNRHEDSPRTGMCPDLEQVRHDLEDLKRLGANFVRLCHYPHHPGELDLCDEVGLLVMAEIPLYWWRGLEEGQEDCARKLESARRQFAALIRRDRSHPSVLFWSASNETEEQRPEVAAGNAELVRLAREMDPTRLAVHVSSRWPTDPHFEEDAVLCVNGYPSWDGRGWRGNPDYDVEESGRWWREQLGKLHALHPDRPVLVTEFGYPCLEGVHNNALGEDMQARAIEAEFRALSSLPYVCGTTLWCYADHPWPEEDFINYLTTSPFGLVTRDRRRRTAYSAVRQLFQAKRGLQPEHAPAAEPGEDIPVSMVRPHLRDIPQVPFPKGFGIRTMRRDEIGLWTDIQRDAEQIVPITDDLFLKEYGSDLVATEWRCFFVVNEAGVAVGTISAWYSRDFRGQDYGRIHWVAVRPAYQGRGLGKAAMSFAMNELARWHDRCWLATSTSRLPALRIYLDFGFQPDLDPPGAIEAWRKVRAALDHPTLSAIPGL